MTFEPGQRVVCVDADDAPQLKLRGIYTIKQIIGPMAQHWRGAIIRGHAIFLYEAEPHLDYFGFAADRFRPIHGRETNISIFTDMLIDVPIEA